MMTRGSKGIFLLALSGAILAAEPAAVAQSFDGITIIELADEAGDNAITGRGRRPAIHGQFLITFVSAQGSYATLTSLRSSRLCVAWAMQGTYRGSSITFGLPPSVASMTKVTPKICQPFTLTYENAETVRVDARNKFHAGKGPLDPAAEVVTYSRPRKVVARVPLVAVDWGSPIFSKHDVKTVKLGPIPAVKSSLDGRARVTIGALRRQTAVNKSFDALFEDKSDTAAATRVHGVVAAGEVLGWPWDVLYGTWIQERTAPSTTAAFEQAVAERYGKESMRYSEGNLKASGQMQFIWAYDLAGRKLATSDAGAQNCLPMADDWLGKMGLPTMTGDVGPWGCILIMSLTHNGVRNRPVSEYRIEAVSGYTLALNHFLTRVAELRELREKIDKLESQRPKL